MKCKNTIAMVLAGAMLLPSNAFAADLSQYRDFPNDWSAKSLEQAIDDGLLNGSNGMIDAKGLLTRAQMAAIVSRAFGAAKTASLDDYRDVLPSAWYYSDMGKAVKMGAFQGANGLLNPDAPITREEAFTVLARAFALEGGGSATLKDFVDGGTVSSWASESVAALVAGGYVNGANGMLNLKNNITRAEFAKVITGMAASYVGVEGVSGKTVEGNVIVRESGASLSGMTINGDLIIAASADKVSLGNVKVSGRLVIRGGADAVGIKNTTTGKGVLVSSPNGAAAISVSGGSVGTVTAKSDLSLSGSVSNVAVTDKATLTVEKNASVGTVTVSAAGSKVTGDGKVTNVQANANNVTVTSKGTKVTAGSGVSGVKAGDKAVESGKTETVGSSSSSSSGGSHSSGGGSSQSQYTYVLMNIPYDAFYKAELKNDKSVDAVSSATKSKPANSNLVSGSYHKGDNSEITGVTFPVRVLRTTDLTKVANLTKVDSENALFAGASYAYYATSTTPSCYKDLTVAEDGSFTLSEVKGTETAVSDAKASIADSSNYGDYQISLSGDELTEDKLGTVYGVVLNTKEGSSYGLRHLENIWLRTNFAFSTGFTATAHGNTLAPEHYKAIMGQTINSITYYTSTGIKTVAVDLYVPIKTEHTLTVANAVDQNTANVTVALPEGYSAKYEVLSGGKAVDGASCNGTTVTLPENAKVGVYTLKVTDENGKYASYSTTFEKQTATNPVAYNNNALSLTAADGKTDADVKSYVSAITEVTVGDKTYVPSGRGNNVAKIFNANGGLDLTTAPFADMAASKTYTITVKATGYSTPLTCSVTIPESIYAYASVPYADYWKNEGVYLEDGSAWDASSGAADAHGEMDKGAFDAVSRATTVHGWHRGSFQQNAVIKTDKGEKYISYWKNEGKTVVLRDGTEAAWDSAAKTLTYRSGRSSETATVTDGYQNLGIKYVPVKVGSSDFVDFCKNYTVTQNGETMQGGYGEKNLSAYTDLVAAVDKNTNGLKEVTKSGTSFAFGARKTGNGSGIKNQALKTADSDIVVTAREYDAAIKYGAHLRVDLTNPKKDGPDKDGKPTQVDAKNAYGALGDNMQTVVWKYYGTGDTVLATYGTKFAADNWMHKSMGIQLGLTDSLRFKLPEGTDGTGKWTITIYALGYSDTTYTVTMTKDNVAEKVVLMTDEQKTKLKELKTTGEGLIASAANADSLTQAESILKEHITEDIPKMLAKTDATQSEAADLISEVEGYIKDVKTERANQPTTKTANGEATVSFGYIAKVTVTFDSDGKVVSVVDNGTEPSFNRDYWNIALGHFDRFVGVTKDTVDSVDATSGATVSMNAVKEAVKNALSND